MDKKETKIIVIDDEAPIRRVIKMKLEAQGYVVKAATDGEEGLQLVQNEDPDVVITDIRMPKLDGVGLCRRINCLNKEKPFLTIVTTCRISPDEEKWIDDMENTILMEKPFSPNELLNKVDEWCDRG